MRHHIVQITRDPPPLLAHRHALALLALTLEPNRPLLQRRRPPRAPLHHERRQGKSGARDHHLDPFGGIDPQIALDHHGNGGATDRHAGGGLARLGLGADREEREEQHERARVKAREGLAIRERDRGVH